MKVVIPDCVSLGNEWIHHDYNLPGCNRN